MKDEHLENQGADFAPVESLFKGADLLRKLMEIARESGDVRRYRSLRRAWLSAQCHAIVLSGRHGPN